MGLTGFFLCSFLVVHLVGNLLLFRADGGIAFDEYSRFMSTNVGIRTIEIGLFAGLLMHAAVGFQLWNANRKVRPIKYLVNASSSTSSIESRIGFVSGSIIFIFLVVHLGTFFFPTRFGEHTGSMYGLVREAFSSPVYSGFYIIAMGFLSYHLRHGFQSAFQTFGMLGTKYKPLIHAVAILFWLLIPLGFASMPVYFLFWKP
jgi:succinate dehydrogenase / fumarate reductase cytochrome b subunit